SNRQVAGSSPAGGTTPHHRVRWLMEEPRMPDDRTALRRDQARASLQDLLDGNERYLSGEPMVPRRIDADSRVSGQHPKAVVIGCVDARVPPEIVLGQGVDDLLT